MQASVAKNCLPGRRIVFDFTRPDSLAVTDFAGFYLCYYRLAFAFLLPSAFGIFCPQKYEKIRPFSMG